MINYLKHMAIFTKVADTGSFSKAAKSLGIAPSRVSETISKLEDYLGVTLLYRTTRHVALTSEGRRFYSHTSLIVSNAEYGLNELRNSKSQPAGSLKISIPAYLSSSTLTRAVGTFVNLHSDVHISISFTDHDVNPIMADFDMCIRSGSFEFQDFTVRKLGEFKRMIVVGTKYFSNHKEPEHPKDLNDWDWINYRHRKRTLKLRSITGKKTTLTINEQSRLRVDNIDALFSFTKMNLGVAVIPENFGLQGVKDGELVHILSDWNLPPVQYYAVWPEKSQRESLISTFVSFLTESLKVDSN
ncbi:LysR family transcriptional regulator [Hellea balneolensis]|uniref:LysR family transcriptional regulator n=1 Tax=Hellea balneolensis TaxID=287478 RepID=UPI0003F6B2F5|nr:LysR family transcriptional regulator [Hellea balneolensis]